MNERKSKSKINKKQKTKIQEQGRNNQQLVTEKVTITHKQTTKNYKKLENSLEVKERKQKYLKYTKFKYPKPESSQKEQETKKQVEHKKNRNKNKYKDPGMKLCVRVKVNKEKQTTQN